MERLLAWVVIDDEGRTLRRCATRQDAVAWAQAHGGLVYVCRAHPDDHVEYDPWFADRLAAVERLLRELEEGGG